MKPSLKENAPGYSRHYRDIDLQAEFQALDWANAAELLTL